MLTVNPDLCQGCGRCSMICFKRAITLPGSHAQIDHGICDGCGSCEAECKQGAITRNGNNGA